jgi:plastocyanin
MSDATTRRGFLVGVAGAGGVAAAGTAAGQEQTTTVDMTDSLVFDPEEVTVQVGTEVVWENVGSVGHSVTAYEDGIPEGADYWASGGFDSESAARGAYPSQGDVPGGESYSHTFETTGTHEYFCIPHESVGMVGEVVVTEDPPPEDTGYETIVPNSAQTLAVWLVAGLTAVLGLTWFFMKFGGDYEAGDEGGGGGGGA